MLDLRKKIFFWSDVAEQITGYPRIDVLGHAYSDLQGIEDVAVGPGIFEKWHGSWTTVFAGLPIGKKAFRLQARQSPGSGSERSRVQINGSSTFGAVGLTRAGHLQKFVWSLASGVSSSGGGLPGRPDLARDQGVRYFGRKRETNTYALTLGER